MLNSKSIMLLLLSGVAVWFTLMWFQAIRKSSKFEMPSVYQMVVGFITDFLDTLGVGSFAVTTSLYRFGNSLRKLLPIGPGVDDGDLPGTLNVGHTLPTILQALIYINLIEIDAWTLWLLVGASVVGSYLGASLVTKLPKRFVQIGMGCALLVAVGFILMNLRKVAPVGGEELGLRGTKLAIGIIGNFVFGALMTIGVGAYAPIMIMVSLLGMNPKAAFPLMMGSCAFLMPVASYRFVKSGKYNLQAALGLTLLGLPGVAIAAGIVKSMSTTTLNWMVVVIVIYTALSMLYAGLKQPAHSEGDTVAEVK